MERGEIEKMASGEKLSPDELLLQVSVLKTKVAGILECTLFVRINQKCSLMEANDIVMTSKHWVDDAESFYQHQAELMAELAKAHEDSQKAIFRSKLIKIVLVLLSAIILSSAIALVVLRLSFELFITLLPSEITMADGTITKGQPIFQFFLSAFIAFIVFVVLTFVFYKKINKIY